MPNATSSLPVLASTELNIFDADQRSRIPAAAGLAATTPASIYADNLRNPELRAACRRSTLPPMTDRGWRVLIEIAEMKVGQPANYVAFLDHLASLIWDAGDSKAVLAQVADLISRVRAEAGE
ncbi:hypothetical protein [Streptomyces sp. NPDC001502]|uniref:hypothetical protein n=1 Tax=Streptomyces sp. NPDC001502 TaxID=3364578 RepID=UPI0036CBEF00